MSRYHRKFEPFLEPGESVIADETMGGPSDRIASNLGCEHAVALLTDRAIRFFEVKFSGAPVRELAAWPVDAARFVGHPSVAKAEWGKLGGRGKELVLRFEFDDGQYIQGRHQPGQKKRFERGFKATLQAMNPQVR